MFKISQFVLFCLMILSHVLLGQTIFNPVVNSKTHPTLDIEKIVKTDSNTVFFMNLRNELEKNGAFCVDNKVFVSIPGKRIKFDMIKSTGIENCPEIHKFNAVGEELRFQLFFPPISDTIKELDLVENCNDNCFTIRGIILDEVINAEIHAFDAGVLYYRKGEYDVALRYFKDIVEKSKNTGSKYYAYSMYILPVIYYNKGNNAMAKEAFEDLLKSDIYDKEYFIDKIKEIDFFK